MLLQEYDENDANNQDERNQENNNLNSELQGLDYLDDGGNFIYGTTYEERENEFQDQEGEEPYMGDRINTMENHEVYSHREGF